MGKIEILAPVIALMLLMAFGGYVLMNQQGENEDDEGGPNDENSSLNEWFVYSVASSDGLPDCDESTKGRLYYVESESSFYICKSNGWMFIDLTGESGATGTPGQNGSSTSIAKNMAPLVSVSKAQGIGGTPVYSSTDGSFIGYSDYNFSIFRTMVDLDGDIMSAGWDFNLDGTIDQISTDASSVDLLSIPDSNWVMANTIPGSVNLPNQFLMTTFAFIAIDDDGAATAELHTVLFDSYEFGDELDTSEVASGHINGGPSGPFTTLNTYTSTDADDAANDATGADDTLIRMQMTGSDDLAWSFVSITLIVGDNIYTCSVTAGDDCVITQSAGSNDNAWEPGEYIFLSEDAAEICSAQGCEVGISVIYAGYTVAGSTSQTVN